MTVASEQDGAELTDESAADDDDIHRGTVRHPLGRVMKSTCRASDDVATVAPGQRVARNRPRCSNTALLCASPLWLPPTVTFSPPCTSLAPGGHDRVVAAGDRQHLGRRRQRPADVLDVVAPARRHGAIRVEQRIACCPAGATAECATPAGLKPCCWRNISTTAGAGEPTRARCETRDAEAGGERPAEHPAAAVADQGDRPRRRLELALDAVLDRRSAAASGSRR